MLKKIEKQPDDNFEEMKNKMLKDQDQVQNSGKTKTEMSKNALDRMNGPLDGVEINEQQWEAIKAETARRRSRGK